MNGQRKLSISVLTYNRRDLLRNLLESLHALRYRPLEVIVVDNHSMDGTSEMVRKDFPWVRSIRTEKNQGATARNLGLKSATGSVIVTLDDDVSGLDDHAIHKLWQYFDRNERLGAVNFKVRDYRTGEISNWVHHYPVENYGEREFSTYEITEGAVAFRREVLEKVGYYPELFFISHEGPDLALRLLNAGYDVIYSPAISVIHAHAQSGRKAWYNYYYDTRNQFWLAVRNFPLSYAVRYLTLGLSSMLVYSLRDGFVHYWVKGVFDGLRGMRQSKRQRVVINREVLSMIYEVERQRPGLRYYLRAKLFKRNVRL